MNSQPDLDRVLGELRDGPVLLSNHPETEAQRRRLLPGLRAQVIGVPQRRLRRQRVRWALGGMLACISLGGLLLVSQQAWEANPVALVLSPLTSGGTYAGADGVSAALDHSLTVATQGELSVSLPATLQTPRGVRVELAEQTKVSLDAMQDNTHATLRLVRGSVHCKVPPLGKASTFSVATPDTEVLVHGTQFSVTLQGPEARTCVRVSEGLVEVRRVGQGSSRAPEGAGLGAPNGAEHVMLRAGESHGCEPATAKLEPASAAQGSPAEEAAQVEPAQGIARVAPKKSGASRVAARAEQATSSNLEAHASSDEHSPEERAGDEPKSTLAEETRWLSLALSAERRGDKVRARELYGKILREYPESPLAPEARRGAARLEP